MDLVGNLYGKSSSTQTKIQKLIAKYYLDAWNESGKRERISILRCYCDTKR
jgi:hypothetical protein